MSNLIKMFNLPLNLITSFLNEQNALFYIWVIKLQMKGDIVRIFHIEQESYVICKKDFCQAFMPAIGWTWSTSIHTLWEIVVVTNSAIRGAVAQWKSLIRFKHLPTGLYLAVVPQNKMNTQNEGKSARFVSLFKLLLNFIIQHQIIQKNY